MMVDEFANLINSDALLSLRRHFPILKSCLVGQLRLLHLAHRQPGVLSHRCCNVSHHMTPSARCFFAAKPASYGSCFSTHRLLPSSHSRRSTLHVCPGSAFAPIRNLAPPTYHLRLRPFSASLQQQAQPERKGCKSSHGQRQAGASEAGAGAGIRVGLPAATSLGARARANPNRIQFQNHRRHHSRLPRFGDQPSSSVLHSARGHQHGIREESTGELLLRVERERDLLDGAGGRPQRGEGRMELRELDHAVPPDKILHRLLRWSHGRMLRRRRARAAAARRILRRLGHGQDRRPFQRRPWLLGMVIELRNLHHFAQTAPRIRAQTRTSICLGLVVAMRQDGHFVNIITSVSETGSLIEKHGQ